MNNLNLPNPLLGAIACGFCVLAGVTGFRAFHRLCPLKLDESEKSLATALLAVVAALNSLLLTFSAVSVWDAYGDARLSVQREADAAGALAQGLAVFGSDEARHARGLLVNYERAVLGKEWPAMQGNRPDDIAWKAFDQLFQAIGHLEPSGSRQLALMLEIWTRADELVQARRARMAAGSAHMPYPLWIVVIAGTMLTICVVYVFPRTTFNITAVALLSLMLGLMFFFIVAMDRPFAGGFGIDAEPIEAALAKMTT